MCLVENGNLQQHWKEQWGVNDLFLHTKTSCIRFFTATKIGHGDNFVFKYLIYRLPCCEHEKGVRICVDPHSNQTAVLLVCETTLNMPKRVEMLTAVGTTRKTIRKYSLFASPHRVRDNPAECLETPFGRVTPRSESWLYQLLAHIGEALTRFVQWYLS